MEPSPFRWDAAPDIEDGTRAHAENALRFRRCACDCEGCELDRPALLEAKLLFYMNNQRPPLLDNLLELYFTIPRCDTCPSHFNFGERHFCTNPSSSNNQLVRCFDSPPE